MVKKICISILATMSMAYYYAQPAYAEEAVAEEEALFDEEESFDDQSFEDDTDESESDLTLELEEAESEDTKKTSDVEEPSEEIAEELEIQNDKENTQEPTQATDTELVENIPPVVEEPVQQAEEQAAPAQESSDMLITSSYEDNPDLVYESKLHDIFLNFYNSKTSEAEWQTLVGQRKAEMYQIQRGDNLWNVSQTIFGDGHYWSKIWSINNAITNPHIISPNNSIRFLLGDESGPPAFTISENISDDSVVSSETEVSATGANTTPVEEDIEPDIPPPLNVSRPVVKKLPPSLPAWQDASQQDNYDEFGISYVRRKILDVEDKIYLPGFIAETLPEDFGRVSEIEVGNNIASAYQYIYVAMKKGYGQIGETYLAVSNRGENKSVHPSIKGFLGYAIDIQGEVQLVEKVSGQDEEKSGEVFRALVLKIVNPVTVGSSLVQGELEKVQITEEGPRSQVVSQVIGGSFFDRRQVYGNESIAFLNRGELDGLERGQILPIRANLQIRNDKTIVRSNVRPIGWARVLRTTPRFATIVIVRAWSDILTGDVTGSGELLPQLANDSGFSQNNNGVSKNSNLDDELDSEASSEIIPDTEQNDSESEYDDDADEGFEE